MKPATLIFSFLAVISFTVLPVNGMQIEIYLTKRPPAVSLLTDTIPIPTHYDHLLTMYVVARALYADFKYEKAGRLMAEYKEISDRFRVDYNERTKEPKEIVK